MKRTLLAGAAAGQAAGLIMAVVVMAVFTVFLGRGPLYPVQVIGSAVVGEPALQGTNVAAILWGLALHQLGPSLAWGIAFALAAAALDVRRTRGFLALGVAVAVLSTLADVYLAVPLLMKAAHGADLWNREVPLFWDWAAHLVFGLSMLLYPAVSRRIGAGAATAVPAAA